MGDKSIRMRRGRFRGRGLTLIEALVVVAIIALLISILLPSLSATREQARAVACSANLGMLTRAASAYQSTNHEWIPGSPWTTGYGFMQTTGAWDPSFGRFAVEWMDYATPLRVQMQGGKTIARDRDAMRKSMTEDVFACPSNPHVMSWGHGPTPTYFHVMKAVSYMTMYGIMSAGPAEYQAIRAHRDLFPGVTTIGHVAQSAYFDVVPPSDYVPRLSRLGRPGLKVFAADGLRFFDPGTRNITFTNHPRAAKGIAQATAPSTAGSNGREYNLAREFSYRHGKGNRIGAGFFDGHVEMLQVDFRGLSATESGYSGPAVHPKYYYPSGSIVKTPDQLHRSDIPAGTKLP